MAHEVESMVYIGETPWHGLGVPIPEGKKLNINEAIIAAGLNWEVGLKHIFTEDDNGLSAGILNRYATYRKTDNAILGIVGAGYKPLQNRDAFNWFQPFLDDKDATIETAGSLKGGSKIWILAKIKRKPVEIKKGDLVQNYILLSNSHDGSLAVRVGFTPIRVVCNNTLCMAHESRASKLLRVKHTTKIIENLENIREIMELANREFEASVVQYKILASKEINTKSLEKYVRKVFNVEEKGGKKLLPKVIYLFEEGRGSSKAGATYWGAYNAVNEYLNYFRGKSQDNTLNNVWFGDSVQINKRALTMALQMAA